MKLPAQFSIGSKIIAGFGAVLSALCLIAVISYHATIKFQEDTARIAHTQAILAKFGTILSQIKGAESGVQGYTLLGKTSLLDALYLGEAKLDYELGELSTLTAHNADQQQQVAALTALIADKIAFLKEVVASRDTQGLQAVQQALLTEKGQSLTDRIRRTVHELEHEEQQSLGIRSRQVTASARQTISADIVGSTLALLSVAAAGIAIHRDLKRKQAEGALQKSEEHYRALFENASDAIVTIALDGTMTGMNRATELLVGHSRENLIGSSYSQVLPLALRSEIEKQHQQLQSTKQDQSTTFEAEVLRSDGRIVPIETRARLIRDLKGKPTGIQTINRDISARKALERQRIEFLAMLTHDIKNPLGVILGYTEFLLENAQKRAAADDEDMLQRLQSSALTIHSLVANYLDLSKVESGRLTLNKQPLLLNDLLQKVGQRYAGEALKQRMSLALHQPKESPVVEGDTTSLERVFSNLLHNAIKFTPELGHIEIRSEQHNGEAVVSIIDSGPGIPPEELPTLFEKYTRGHAPQREGTGLGLFIVKTFTEAHGGRVEVKSEPGEGSCFSVRLPAMANEESLAIQETLL